MNIDKINNYFVYLFSAFLILAFIFHPYSIYKIYSKILLGRLLLITLIIYLTLNNFLVGLLATCIIIFVLAQYSPLTENLENIGAESTTSNGSLNVLTKAATANTHATAGTVKDKISNLKTNIANSNSSISGGGVDKQDIANAIASKPSKEMPIPSLSSSSDEIKAHDSSILNNSTKLSEKFTNNFMSL